jgi:selenide,water dikinase
MSTEPPKLTSLAHGGGCGCKISPAVLRDILADLPSTLPYKDLLVGTETADDAAVYRLNDEQALIATTDFFMPVVDDPYDFGRIAAANALSDVYAMGGTPILALAIVGMPINILPTQTIRDILRGGRDICQSAGIAVAGGHSIDSVEPIYGLVALGLVHPKQIQRNANAQVGDRLVLGKPLGVGVYSAALKKGALAQSGYEAMIQSTTLLNRAGSALAKIEGVNAMTDVTGFGLLGHAHEMAHAATLGFVIQSELVPWLPGVMALAESGHITGASKRNWDAYGHAIQGRVNEDMLLRDLLTDPQTSGGLLVSCHNDALPAVLAAFEQHGNQATVIGEVTATSAGVTVV